MKLRSPFTVLVVLAAALVAVTYFTFRTQEPRLDGQPLSFWLREAELINDPLSPRNQAATRAVRQIGSAAVPALLRMLQTPDSQWKSEAVDWLQENAEVDLSGSLGGVRARRAVLGFRLLGRTAAAAVPKLARLATSPDPRTSTWALLALGEIGGPEVLPTLVAVLTNGTSGARSQAVAALSEMRSEGGDAVPALLQTLPDTDPNLRAATARALGEISLVPEQTVPALTGLLADSNPPVRMAAATALGNFGKRAEGAIPALREWEQSSDDFSKRVAPRVIIRVQCEMYDNGIIRGPVQEKRIAFVFTGHEFAEGADTILEALARHEGHASFFLTGTFLADSNHAALVQRMIDQNHYVGPHSDRHLLYCAWEDRRTLVTEEDFANDLIGNTMKIPGSGNEIRRFNRYFLPAYEHYNREIVDWARRLRWILINYTPGTHSNADYTGEADRNFVSSQAIYDSIVQRERADPHGLNGFLLLLHVGSGPGRADKFHTRFGGLLDYLAGKGYEFVRVDQLLGPPPPRPVK